MSQATGEFDGGDGLVNCVERTSQKARLLTRDYGEAIRFSQQFNILETLLTTSPNAIHASERIADATAINYIGGLYFPRAQRQFVMKANRRRIKLLQ